MRNNRMPIRRALAGAVLVVALAGCTPEQWIALRFDEVGQTAQATAVARCESGLNPAAVSPGGGNHGLFQINSVHRDTFQRVTGRPWADVYQADANTLFARWLYDRQGWAPWTCQP